MASITLCDSRSCACAAALSPEAIAFRTFLSAVRSSDRWAALWALRFRDCRARLRACAVFAMTFVSFAGNRQKKALRILFDPAVCKLRQAVAAVKMLAADPSTLSSRASPAGEKGVRDHRKGRRDA